MRIAIDTSRANRPLRTGPASYAWHVIREMLHSTQNTERYFALLAPEGPSAGWGALPPSVAWKTLRWLGPGWTSIRLPWHLRSARYEAFWEPTAGLPWLPQQTRGVVTIHDVSFLEAPEVYDPADLARQRRALKTLSRADRVITVSRYSERLLVERCGVPPTKLAVTPLAADEEMSPQPPEVASEALSRLGVRAPYLMTVGRIERKKGIVEIIEALSQLPDDLSLVLVGPNGFGLDEVDRRIADLKLERRVRRLSWADYADLSALLTGAACYVSACRYEGFGIAVLDALACGCPVVAYRAGAVPETVGEAAVLVDPSGPEALVEGIGRVLGSASLAAQLRASGLERAAGFSWSRTAQLTAAALLAGR